MRVIHAGNINLGVISVQIVFKAKRLAEITKGESAHRAGKGSEDWGLGERCLHLEIRERIKETNCRGD